MDKIIIKQIKIILIIIPAATMQRVLDSIVVNHTFQTLLEIQTTQYHRARLVATKSVQSGD